jgi:hypothetical protein
VEINQDASQRHRYFIASTMPSFRSEISAITSKRSALSGSLGRRTVALLSLTIVVADAKTTSINYLWLATGEGPMKPGEKEKGKDLATRLEELQEDFPNFEITAKVKTKEKMQAQA